ncbi:Gfo/Idh/MocA family protein [Chloroflexota bacterium]
MIKIGIIGSGKIAEKHLAAYKHIHGIELALSDIDNNGQEIAQSYRVNWHNNPQELIASDLVDAIDICIPTVSHADYIIKALNCRKHVFCEKPMANTLEEAQKIKNVIKKTDSVFMEGYLYRFHPAIQLAKEIIDESIIGDPYYSILRLGGRGSHRSWKHQFDMGGGAAKEMMVHMLDLALWYFGGIKKVNKLYTDIILKKRLIEGKDVTIKAEDICLISLESNEGVRILCESDLITPSYMNYIEIHGTNGSLWTSILDYLPTIIYCIEPKGGYDRGHNYINFPKVDLFQKELSCFVNCMLGEEVPQNNSIEHSIEVLRLAHSAMIKQT